LRAGRHAGDPVLVALFVCLIPTTIGGLLSAPSASPAWTAGEGQRHRQVGRAVEAAGDVDVLLLDKTGTITFGNRMASAFRPAPGVDRTGPRRRRAARLARRRDPGGQVHRRARQREALKPAARGAARHFVPFTAQTRMSGVDLDGGASARARPTR
jgi:potassium-transporting ATPase ATP-binding subunit